MADTGKPNITILQNQGDCFTPYEGESFSVVILSSIVATADRWKLASCNGGDLCFCVLIWIRGKQRHLRFPIIFACVNRNIQNTCYIYQSYVQFKLNSIRSILIMINFINYTSHGSA